MERKEHGKECLQRLGDDFDCVHVWLDELFQDPRYRSRHRRVRHNKQGIETVRRLWGDRAALAAELHIKSDLEEEGYSRDLSIPMNEEQYVKLGLW